MQRPRLAGDELQVLELSERETGKAGLGQEDEERRAGGQSRLRRDAPFSRDPRLAVRRVRTTRF
ncbi:MAG TPA: hypothetical protein VN806_13835 [Caulobacteraceae bacterium]|nr:hypothetical protein [Caulobacteraceae bacterium]